MRAILWRFRWLICVIAAVVVVSIGAAITLFSIPEKFRALAKKVGGYADIVAQVLPQTLPVPTKVEKAYWLNQNWTAQERYWFHHTSQGTATFPVPYAWFLALERPEFSLLGRPGLLRDDEYLRRLGFITSPETQTFQSDASSYGYSKDGKGATGDPAKSSNPHGLPVGFAKLGGGVDPTTGESYPDQIGFTCSACHTGHIEYKNVSIRFDGGPAMVNLGELERAVGLSIAYTYYIPFRFDRFAAELSKVTGSQVNKADLQEQLKSALGRVKTQKKREDSLLERHKLKHLDEGFGRLDALNRIGNQVFFADMLPANLADSPTPKELVGNFARHDAPVSFPPIWDTPWFLWSQYDASVLNELVRNAGEALGVSAKLNLTVANDDKRPLFSSSIKLDNIHGFESLLRGAPPFSGDKPGFKGLIAPKWSEASQKFPDDRAWAIDEKKAGEGRDLYRKYCVECHRGPVADPRFDEKYPDYSFWRPDNPDGHQNWITIGGQRYFNVVQKPVSELGTDRQQSRVLIERKVTLPAVWRFNAIDELNTAGSCGLLKSEKADVPFVLALMAVVDKTIDQWLKQNPTPAEVEKEMRGPRKNCQNTRVFRNVRPVDSAFTAPVSGSVAHYRARPLNGIWATAPYLHNGSVPTLHHMLLPQGGRPSDFCVGSRQFDPEKVGLKVIEKETCAAGLTRFDTTELGNSNLGHSFEGSETDTRKLSAGVVGPELTGPERDALVEYLKTL